MSFPVSVCIIACDEEEAIGACLRSVAWADERIVVVDAKSRDETLEIARGLATRVLVHPYQGNVEQKNLALSHAERDWVLALDADEAVSPELAAAIQAAVAGGARDRAGYEMNRVTFHLGRWIRHGDFHPDWQLRLFQRQGARWSGVNPHGRVRVAGPVGRLEGDLEHASYRDLADQVERAQGFSRVQAEALHASGRRARPSDLWLRPPARFLRGYLVKQGFRDGVPGLVIAAVSAFHVFLKYAKLWELERHEGGSPRR